MKIELYIDKQLCDIGDPEKFSVYLKRQLYNPAELNTKDAQVSYSITLPASNTNNRIFGYANVEEVRGKFERLYDAQLIVNGIRIFDGKFRLNEIVESSYKGNLGIPAPKTVKDIFGDKAMNRLDKWILPLEEYNGFNFITGINNQDNPDCIFPLVLYGLLPKISDLEGKYTEKNLLDESVRFGIEDFPPSINCLKMLEKIFSNAGYSISGNAFQDERLKGLYMSYKNPNNYVQEWNWGDLATIDISAKWSMANKIKQNDFDMFERQIDLNSDDYGKYFNVNLFNSNRLTDVEIADTGTNVIYSEYKDKYADKPYTRKTVHVTIPKSGYYKVGLKCDRFNLNNDHVEAIDFSDLDKRFTATYQNNDKDRNNRFDRSRYEIQVLRDFGEGDFHNNNLVGLFDKPQFPQTDFRDEAQFPKYYPYAGGPLVVDPGVNQNFVCGLRWGTLDKGGTVQWNPMDTEKKANYMFMANGFSWDTSFTQKKKILSAYDSSNYQKNDITGEYWRNFLGNYHCWGVEEKDMDEDNPDDKDEPEPTWLNKEIFKIRHAHFQEMPGEGMGNKPRLNYVTQKGDVEGEGYVESVIWLEKGERIAVAIAGDMGDRKKNNHKATWDQWVVLIDEVVFSLHIEPFRTDIEWSNLDSQGSYNESKILSWNDEVTFQQGKINLMDFLPSDQKIDDWLENFCKAFNLSLTHAVDNKFELSIKQKEVVSISSRLIDIDNRENVVHRGNEPLSLPAKYKLGFAVNTDERGYYKSMKEDAGGNKILNSGLTGGGEYKTGSHDTNEIEQTTNFSYCWYEKLYRKTDDDTRELLLEVPVITDHGIWDKNEEDYKEMLSKLYFDKAQRFWYRDNLFPVKMGKDEIQTAVVSNSKDRSPRQILYYEDKPDSIMRNYFYLLDNTSDYTEIECYLTAEEYDKANTSLVKFNNDLYSIASIDGYDPACRKRAKLRLIKKRR